MLADIRAGDLCAVYLLWGEDHAAMHEVVEEIRTAVLRPGGKDNGMEAFNHERFEAPYLKAAATVLNACAQAPMLSPRRLVELVAPEDFGKHKRAGDETGGEGLQSKRDSAIDALLAYMKEPCPSTVLLMTSTGVSGTSKLVKAAKKQAGVAEHKFAAAKDNDAMAGLMHAAKRLGVTLDREAARALILAVGTTHAELDPALARVAAYVADREPPRISRADVESLVVRTREANVFELTDAIGRRDHRAALALLAQMFVAEKDTGTAMRVLGMLTWHMRRLFVAATQRDPASSLGVKPFAAKKLAEQVRHFDEARLRMAYAGLAKLDDDLKGGSKLASASPYLALQRWILDTCGALEGVDPRV